MSSFDSICTSPDENFSSRADVQTEKQEKARSDDPRNSFLFCAPTKKSPGCEMAVPMFPSHKSEVSFSPPVKVSPGRERFNCGNRMVELLSRLPDYDEFQSKISRLIYVPQRETKGSPKKDISDTGNCFIISEGPDYCTFLRTPQE